MTELQLEVLREAIRVATEVSQRIMTYGLPEEDLSQVGSNGMETLHKLHRMLDWLKALQADYHKSR